MDAYKNAKVDLVRAVIEQNKGKIIACTFIKKDGSVRDIAFRTGVTKHVKGTQPEVTMKRNETLEKNNMVGVYEMKGKDSVYRTLNLETVTYLKIGEKAFTF